MILIVQCNRVVGPEVIFRIIKNIVDCSLSFSPLHFNYHNVLSILSLFFSLLLYFICKIPVLVVHFNQFTLVVILVVSIGNLKLYFCCAGHLTPHCPYFRCFGWKLFKSLPKMNLSYYFVENGILGVYVFLNFLVGLKWCWIWMIINLMSFVSSQFTELVDHIKFDHGYTASSPPVLNVSIH